jgi:hypothetical protein
MRDLNRLQRYHIALPIHGPSGVNHFNKQVNHDWHRPWRLASRFFLVGQTQLSHIVYPPRRVAEP